MKIIEKIAKTINKDVLLKHNAPTKAQWLTFWPEIKTTKESTQIILPVAPILLGLVVVIGITGWYLWQNKLFQRNTANSNQDMLSTISQVIELPAETPQVAIVSDVSLLNQPFFENARNGDYVIVYQQSQKVLLYRPGTKKVINFANIQIPASDTNTFIQQQ